jgi:hypothetical protein
LPVTVVIATVTHLNTRHGLCDADDQTIAARGRARPTRTERARVAGEGALGIALVELAIAVVVLAVAELVDGGVRRYARLAASDARGLSFRTAAVTPSLAGETEAGEVVVHPAVAVVVDAVASLCDPPDLVATADELAELAYEDTATADTGVARVAVTAHIGHGLVCPTVAVVVCSVADLGTRLVDRLALERAVQASRTPGAARADAGG